MRLSRPEKVVPEVVTWERIFLLWEEQKPGTTCCVEQ